MRYALVRTITTNQRQFVETHGDAVWEWVCDTFPGAFTIGMVTECPALSHYATRTRTDAARAIISNVLAESDDVLEKRGNWHMWKS